MNNPGHHLSVVFGTWARLAPCKSASDGRNARLWVTVTVPKIDFATTFQSDNLNGLGPTVARMILIVDNYDSFTYNLVQRFGEIDAGLEIEVVRNDKTTPDEIAGMSPSHLIISPGPCTPNEAGISVDCVQRFAGRVPLLGVCLGHQSIGAAYGAQVVRAERLMHGKTDTIEHDGSGILAGLPSPLVATRYHSLIVRPDSLPDELIPCAWSTTSPGDRELMAVRHRSLPVFGVQFHPESFLSDEGTRLLANFLNVSA